jgi:hypothetical protein
MDSIDPQRIRIHHDESQVCFVAADDERLKALRAVGNIVEYIAELLPVSTDVKRIESSKFRSVPAIEEMATVPTLDRNQGWLGQGSGVGMGMVHRMLAP